MFGHEKKTEAFTMNITAIRSDRMYREMMNAVPAEKENIYRDKLMKPFEFKWSCVGIPLRAETEGRSPDRGDRVGDSSASALRS